jgi:pimeloyl-ACP methyl ester carboxylesterase
MQGETSQAVYRLDDLADDAAGLLNALGTESALVVGASMGGMIAQLLVIRHPVRVRTLTSIMSTTAPVIGVPTPQALKAIMAQSRAAGWSSSWEWATTSRPVSDRSSWTLSPHSSGPRAFSDLRHPPAGCMAITGWRGDTNRRPRSRHAK